MKYKLSEMRLGTQIRIALLLFLLALVTANLLSTVTMLKSRFELERQEQHNFAAASLALAHTAMLHQKEILANSLVEDMAVAQTEAAAGLYDENGARLSTASLSGDNAALNLLPIAASRKTSSMPTVGSVEAATRTLSTGENDYFVTEVPLIKLGNAGQQLTAPQFYLVLIASKSPRFTAQNYFVFAFQAASILLCLLFIHFFSRWLIYPYNQIESMARASSLVMKGASNQSEQQNLINTFEAAIKELKVKEQKLQQINQKERERAEGYERLSARILTSIPSGLVAIDSKGRLIVANEQAYRILNNEPQPSMSEEQGYMTLFQACPSVVELVADTLSSGRTYRRHEIVFNLQEKGSRVLEVSVSPLGKGYKDIQGALCLIADITEVTALREQIRVRENLASLGEMAAGIAHEFKNSLATIQGFAQLIENSGSGLAQHREIASSLSDETRHLTQMVTDFLRFARPEQIHPSEVDLDELTRDCIEGLDNLRKELDIEVIITGQLPEISGDLMMLRHAFLNLLRNAMEAMAEAPARQLKINMASSYDVFGRSCAAINISDTGCGIPSDALSKIFIPFFSTKSRGYGIGLAIVQKVFSGHGGSIEVTSTEGVGTTFQCLLPVASDVTKPRLEPTLATVDAES
ncbi:MAG TPA: ATP-binding protein [Blastocatellia bacterium]|nr:ATP-binding protein [Blastocatellia bacterium]